MIPAARAFWLTTLLWPFAVLAQTDHVILIGIDGLGAEGLRENSAPRMQALMRGGVWSLKARGVMPTMSSPNWASMIMGAGPEQHGVTTNDWKPDKFDFAPVCRGTSSIFPTVFGLLRQQQPESRIAIFHDWNDFARLVEINAPTLMQHTPGPENTIRAAVSEWRANQPRLMFVHLDSVDHAGHAYGWRSSEYARAVSAVDTFIGQLVDAVKSSESADRTTILISADHGGMENKHGGNTMTELEIPWIASGAGIGKTGELSPPINTYDTAATIAALLRLHAPSCWLGKPVVLSSIRD